MWFDRCLERGYLTNAKEFAQLDEPQLWELLQKSTQENKRDLIKGALVLKYTPLVHKIARQVYKSHCSGLDYDYDDYVSFAYIGLLDAIEKFNVAKKTKFSTYAQLRIYGAIIDEIRKLSYIPRTSLNKILKFKAYLQTAPEYNSLKKTERQLATEFNLNDREYSLLHQPAFISLDTKSTSLSDDVDNHTIRAAQSKFPDGMVTPDAHEQLEYKENINKLNILLNTLPDKNKKIVIDVFFNKKTHADVGRNYSMSTTRVAQILNFSLRSMREYAQRTKLGVAL